MTDLEEPEEQPKPAPQAIDVKQRTHMAAERTWLAWWRTALGATVGALGVGRIAPEALDVKAWPYVVLGLGYAAIAIGLLAAGYWRQRNMAKAVDEQLPIHLPIQIVAGFTFAGAVLAVITVVLVVGQT